MASRVKINAQTEGALATAEKNDTRIYHPAHNSETGGALPTIFLDQMRYYWHLEWKGHKPLTPFYKFVAPCNHPLHKPGDSWVENLGIGKTALTSYFKKFGRKLRGNEQQKWSAVIAQANRQEVENEADPVYFVYWTRRTDNLTYWAFNDEAYLRMRLRAYKLNSDVNLDSELSSDVNSLNSGVNLLSSDANSLSSQPNLPINRDYPKDYPKEEERINTLDINEENSINNNSLSHSHMHEVDSPGKKSCLIEKPESISPQTLNETGDPTNPTPPPASGSRPQQNAMNSGASAGSRQAVANRRWRSVDSMSREEIIAELSTLPNHGCYLNISYACGYDPKMMSKSKRRQVLEAAKTLWFQEKRSYPGFRWRDWWDQYDWRSKCGTEAPNNPQIILDTWIEYERQFHRLKRDGHIRKLGNLELTTHRSPDRLLNCDDLDVLKGYLADRRNLYRYWAGEIEARMVMWMLNY